MSILGNIFWFICGGFLSGLSWLITGVLWCVSIIGIPIGIQCFKFAGLAFWPFGKDIVYGGGLKQDNAEMLASIDEIDGGLIALTRFQGEIGYYPEEYLRLFVFIWVR